MRTKLFVGKFVVLFIGLSVLLASMSFGSSTGHREISLMWRTPQNSFSLAKSMSTGLKWNCLVDDSTDTGKWTALVGMAPPSRIDWDIALSGDESGVTESRPKRGKLAFVLRAGSASITAEGYGSSFTYGGGFFLHLSQRIGLEIVMDRYSVPVSKDLGGMGTGKMQVTPFLMNSQLRFPLGRFVPYVAAGVGFYFLNYVPDPQVQPLATQDLVVDDRFSLHFGGGVDIQVTRNLDFCADLRYSFIKTWIQARDEHHVDPADQDMFSLNTLVLALGIRYYF